MHMARCHILYCNIESVTIAVDENKTSAVRAVTRTHIIGPFEGQPLGRTGSTSRDSHTVDLGASAAIRSKNNVPPVGGEVGFGINCSTLTEPLQPTAICVDQKN